MPVTVVAALIWREGRLLVCQRKPDDAFAGKWEFPGGKIELVEEPRAALARELQEELRIHATIGAEIWRTEHQYPGHSPVHLIFFEVFDYEGIAENRAFQQIVWARPQELTRYDFLEADRPLIARLVDRKDSPPGAGKTRNDAGAK
jgi:8-oxo-dGTP diphosphatase